MNQTPRDAGPLPNVAAPALVALSSRTDLPPRAKHLLEGTLAICCAAMQHPLAAALDDFEVQLFKRAEQLRGGEAQHRCFDTLREMKLRRADIAPRFSAALEDALAHFDRARPAKATTAPRAPSLRDLSLVKTRDLEETLALQEFSARAEIRQAQALYALGHRFGVLAASPFVDAEHLAIGPAGLAAALRYGCLRLEIEVEHRVLLYHAFDHVTTEVLDELYAKVNRYLSEHRILRHLHVMLAPRPKDGPVEQHAAAPAPGSTAEFAEPADAHGRRPAQTRAADAHDAETFAMMRELLNGRHSSQSPSGRTGDNFLPSEEQVQSVLGALQARPIAPMLQDGKLAPRSVAVLKQELLANLRAIAPNGQAPRLSEADSDTIDLVGMLFEHLAGSTRPHGNTQPLMTKLQAPLLRVALRDKSFFTRRSHPARQLLNAIVETGNHWLDDRDGATDRGLAEKVQLVVDRVVRDFDGNDALLEDMLGELSRHMRMLARKAEVTERRHVDAARGREKLGLAREQARTAIATRIARSKASKLVRTLLEQAWTDVLALTLLRHGEKSEAYTNRLAVADKLLTTNAGSRGDAMAQTALREEIETALDQVGYHRDDVQLILQRFFESEPAQEDDPSSSTEIAIKLKKKPHLGDDAAAAATPKHVPALAEFAAGGAEARMLERLRALPFGTWFELSVNQKGERARRKLAWYSTVTGHCLFVNQHGVRTDEKTLPQLALDLTQGRATIVEAETESLVDRAWKSVMTSLRHLVGRDPPAKPA